jgi:hypothetical protein
MDLLGPSNGPWQIDLMNLSQTDCLLTQLGSTSGITTGQYQQIRLYLLSNDSPENTPLSQANKCTTDTFNGFNCVVTSTGTHILELSSEAQTGIKIPSGQIAGGKFVVPAGGVVDLNIDFDGCSSIVQQPDGQFRLKPVLHAAELSLNNSISGKVVVINNNTESIIPGAAVFLEQKDSAGIDRMIMQTRSKSDGTFIFCPVSAGSFDVVADALLADGTTYSATITFGVPSGTAMGNIPLITKTKATPARITGQITTTTGSAAIQADISVSALQTANNISVTIPLLGPSSTLTVTTQGVGCPANTHCAGYTLSVPATNPSFATFPVKSPTDYSVPPDPGPAIGYSVNAQAATCSSPSSIEPVTVTPGGTTNQGFSFTGCQQ